MSIKKVKSDIFGTISSFRTLINNYPKLSQTNSFSSINNSPDPLDFIVDLFKSLGDTDRLTSVLSNILINNLEDIELRIKDVLKKLIRDNISCNVDPSIIDFLFNNGINLSLNEVDITNLMRKSPFDDDSSLFYFSPKNLYDSSDFNAFLYYVVNMSQVDNTWGLQQNVFKNNIINIQYFDNNTTLPLNNGEIVSQILNIRVNDYYKPNINSNILKLSNFNSDFIDSIKLFNNQNLIGKIFDRVFGSLSFSIKRTTNEIFIQNQIESIINRLSVCDNTNEIDNSFFTFSNEEYNQMLEDAELRKIGVMRYNGNNIDALQLTTDELIKTLDLLQDPTASLHDQKVILDATINNAVNGLTQGDIVSSQDKHNFKINLIKKLMKELSLALTTIILSPKVYILLLLNLTLLGIKSSNNVIDVIQNNKKLISEITQSIRDSVLDAMLSEIKLMARDLVVDVSKHMAKEQINLHKEYLKSLIIPEKLRGNGM